MIAEASELQPGPKKYIHTADQPFGKPVTDSLDATFRGKGVETRRTYGVPVRMFSWQLGESSSQGPRVKAIHILPEENKFIYEGDTPTYPLPENGHNASGSVHFDMLIAEERAGTLSVQFTQKEQGRLVSRILDINRSGQLHMHQAVEAPIPFVIYQPLPEGGYVEEERMP